MGWRLTPWWGVLLDGIIGAFLSGVVAAGTAWLVVNLTSRRQRRDALSAEARQAPKWCGGTQSFVSTSAV
jgi:hypothetical protein